MFRALVVTGLVAGLVAGLVLSAVQFGWVTPLILEAERYEHAAEMARSPGGDSAAQDLPPAGLDTDRILYTLIANTLGGMGFALILAAVVGLHGGHGWGRGVLWGLAGYAVFFAAPALGLPPEVPGLAGAELADRQFWWLATVVATAGGLVLLLLCRGILLKGAGVLLVLAPHLFGAPPAPVAAALVPDTLIRAYITAVASANAVFWLALGAVTGAVLRRFDPPRPANAASRAA
ncbi:MAG TPA: cobalt transporter [Gammaproteobacteria bacterium]|nr:cobalt transporter [Gammaproteobacteria bacterium]